MAMLWVKASWNTKEPKTQKFSKKWIEDTNLNAA
jgi:hypothetical protein